MTRSVRSYVLRTMRDRTRAHLRTLVRDALVVIERDLEHDLALDEVARGIATSRRSLQRAFEQEGITFREAVAVARMRHAKALFADGRLPVYRVADRVGYRSKAEFTKAFKRYSGMTPTDYIRSLREGAARNGHNGYGSEHLHPRRPAGHAEGGQPLGHGGAPQRLYGAELHA